MDGEEALRHGYDVCQGGGSSELLQLARGAVACGVAEARHVCFQISYNKFESAMESPRTTGLED